mgnify:CR=1 FL=1
MKDDNVYIEQMLESVNKIKQFTEGMDQREFFSDQKTILLDL